MSKLVRANLARLDEGVDEERLQNLRRRFTAGPATRYVIRPLLLATLVGTLMTGLLAVIVEITINPRWFRLLPLLFLIALEAIYTTNWLSHPRQLPLDRARYRAAELLLLLVTVRAGSWIIFGEGLPDAALFERYLRSPQDFFLNVPFLVAVILAAIAWRLAVELGAIFNRLEISESELRFQSLPLAQRKARGDDQPIHTARGELVQAYTRFWLLGGVLLAFAVGLSTLEQQNVDTLLAPLVAARANLDPQLLGALLLYFVIGLWLLSEVRLMQTNARWLVNSITTDENARRNWQRASLATILLVAFVAALLPIGSTNTLSQIVNVLLYWLLFLANVIIFLITLPFALLLALFSNESTPRFEPLGGPLQAPPMQPPPETNSSSLVETISMILSSGFWAVFIVFVALALLFFLRERKPGAGTPGSERPWDRLRAWLAAWWQKIRGRARSLQASLTAVLEVQPVPDEEEPQQRRWRFIRVGGLPPREQLRYFYLSTLRRAGDQGVNRPPADTPAEFLDTLQQYWPQAGEELDALTLAFLKARYSDKPIDEQDVPAIKATWKAVRRELKHDPHAGDREEESKE